ncbi:lipase/acyltransferase domain-containing protein [Bacillus anthracis]|uniref:lipase/acyltransferase domain-containing protein n=1 Tax=Bacillus anthracis TaxID=1392 RepID=UPI001AE978E2|nr:acyltransferase [Bacillus anthracis]MBP0833478.1 acyltransferase [Bacillus anthracis]
MPQENEHVKPNKQIIIIPGIMGSKLKEQQLTIWIPHIKSTFSREFNLHEKLKLKQKKNHFDASTGILGPFYGRLKSVLQDYAKHVDEFFYDWRLGNQYHLERLKKLIKTDVDEVIIVAHSMGGLIAKACLNEFASEGLNQKISKVITMGTPWAGAPTAYKALKHGAGIPKDWFPVMMSAEKTKDLARTFESVYQLLPNINYYQEYDEECKLAFTEYNGKSIKSWEDIYSDIYKPLLKDKDFDFVEGFNHFQNLIKGDMNVEHHEIIGYGKGTYCSFKRDKKEKTKAIFGDGDGTVPLTSAKSESSIKYYVDRGHQFLPNDSVVLDIVKCIVHGEDPKQTDDFLVYKKFLDDYTSDFNAKVIKVACPVLVTLSDENNDILYGSTERFLNEEDLIGEHLEREDIDITYLDDTMYILLPYKNDQELKQKKLDKIQIEAYDEGATSITIEEYKDGKITEINSFDSFIIDQNKTAEFTIPVDSSESRLVIKENETVDIRKPKNVKKVNVDELKLPETKISIQSNKQRKINDKMYTYVVGGEVLLSVNNILEGTYPVTDTYYSINDGKFNLIFTNDLVKLKLNEGKNVLNVFSTDSAGNAEATKTYTLYYVKNVIPKIVMRFYPKSYKLEYEQINQEMYKDLKLNPPKVSFSVEPKDGMTESLQMVSYREIERNIKIEYANIFNDKEILESKIDEKLMLSILGAQGTEEDLNKILNDIGIREPFDVRITKKDEKGTPKTIQTKYIRKAKEIIINHEIFFIEIVRDSSHAVSFQNLSEDIKIDEIDQHVFKFKVLDENVEIKNLTIQSEINMIFKNGEKVTIPLVNHFDTKDDNYHVLLNVKDLEKHLNQFWSKDALSKIDLIIEEIVKGKNKLLRVQPITIR